MTQHVPALAKPEMFLSWLIKGYPFLNPNVIKHNPHTDLARQRLTLEVGINHVASLTPVEDATELGEYLSAVKAYYEDNGNDPGPISNSVPLETVQRLMDSALTC